MTTLEALAEDSWDVLVVGGGITGAGILREAANRGLRAALVEQNDFSSGTSSRSSKLIHGGLRYLAQGQIRLLRESVQERARLLRDGTGLVELLGYTHAIYRGDRPGSLVMELALRVYALLHGSWRMHRRLPTSEVGFWIPGLSEEGLEAVFSYGESRTDDSRLVLRILREATDRGAAARNYTFVSRLIRDDDGQVHGAELTDRDTGRQLEMKARVVVNATGAWADRLRGQLDLEPVLRTMRGSHLVIPGWRFRLGQVASFVHPENNRPLYCVPWKGVVLVGTTDLDQPELTEAEPKPDAEEVQFLLRGIQARFPKLGFKLSDVQAVFAGVRTLADLNTRDPSKASREHLIRTDAGLLTVTGGKLTNYRLMAREALDSIHNRLGAKAGKVPSPTALDPLPSIPADFPLPTRVAQRWLARYGPASLDFLAAATSAEIEPIPGTGTLMPADLRWMAQRESVRHLDDLMLRRTRLGLTYPLGGARLIPRIRKIVQADLDWSDDRWKEEEDRYNAIWDHGYRPPRL